MRDDEYIRLFAWHLFDEHLTLNVLRHRDRNLFDTIMRGVDHYFYQQDDYLWVDNPYIAILEEAKTDVEEIINLHNIERSKGYLLLIM